MYRNCHEFFYPKDIDIVDFYFHIEHASKGSIYLDRRVLGCYRIHNHGISKKTQNFGIIEKCHEAAFDRALELGVSSGLVMSSRLK
jgi:hypothetical protein